MNVTRSGQSGPKLVTTSEAECNADGIAAEMCALNQASVVREIAVTV
jgi:hypothetical protein